MGCKLTRESIDMIIDEIMLVTSFGDDDQKKAMRIEEILKDNGLIEEIEEEEQNETM